MTLLKRNSTGLVDSISRGEKKERVYARMDYLFHKTFFENVNG
jgi:hypothetical protein